MVVNYTILVHRNVAAKHTVFRQLSHVTTVPCVEISVAVELYGELH